MLRPSAFATHCKVRSKIDLQCCILKERSCHISTRYNYPRMQTDNLAMVVEYLEPTPCAGPNHIQPIVNIKSPDIFCDVDSFVRYCLRFEEPPRG